jgi:hypothetical protein
VVERYGGQLPADTLAEIQATLVRRASMAKEAAALSQSIEIAAAMLRAERDGLCGWRLRRGGFRAVAAGLERTARDARRAMRKAIAGSRSRDYHTWRQRVKDQWLQVRLLQGRCGGMLALDERRLEALDGCLGECHNCAILRDVLTSDSTLDRSDAAHAVHLVRLYERELRRRARRLGTRIHQETPRQFVTRVRRLWHSDHRSRRPQRGTSWRSAA